jgi:hypothetical protein
MQGAMSTAVHAEESYLRQNDSYTTSLKAMGDALKPPGIPGEWITYHVQIVLKDGGKTFCVQGTSDVSGHTLHYDLGSGEALDGSC